MASTSESATSWTALVLCERQGASRRFCPIHRRLAPCRSDRLQTPQFTAQPSQSGAVKPLGFASLGFASKGADPLNGRGVRLCSAASPICRDHSMHPRLQILPAISRTTSVTEKMCRVPTSLWGVPTGFRSLVRVLRLLERSQSVRRKLADPC